MTALVKLTRFRGSPALCVDTRSGSHPVNIWKSLTKDSCALFGVSGEGCGLLQVGQQAQ